MTLLPRIICFSLLLATSAYAGQNPRPPAHYEDYGACPFECCTYRRWGVVANTVLYKQRSTSSGVAFRVKKGEHVVGVTGVVVTLKPGKAIVKKATTLGSDQRKVRLKPGDVFYPLHYEGEGFSKIWFRGRIFEEEMPNGSDEFIQVVSEPKYVWWVKVRNSKGQIGWSKQDENFDNMDACG